MEAKQNTINQVVDIVYLTPENAEFTVSENNFLQLKAKVVYPESLQDNLNKTNVNEENKIEEFIFERVFLHRAFPFDNPFKFISVIGNFPKEEKKDKDKKDAEKTKTEEAKPEESKDKSPAPPRENTTSLGDLKEIGIISDVSVFDEIQKQYLINELDRKYFTPVIEVIYNVKDKWGYTYWEVKTDVGKIKFSVNDTYRNITKITEDRIMITDVNGNRYEIKSLQKIDRPSFRKIELYL
jgi:hypothetical protein